MNHNVACIEFEKDFYLRFKCNYYLLLFGRILRIFNVDINTLEDIVGNGNRRARGWHA